MSQLYVDHTINTEYLLLVCIVLPEKENFEQTDRHMCDRSASFVQYTKSSQSSIFSTIYNTFWRLICRIRSFTIGFINTYYRKTLLWTNGTCHISLMRMRLFIALRFRTDVKLFQYMID